MNTNTASLAHQIPADAIATAPIESSDDLGDLLVKVVEIAARDRPFGVLLLLHGAAPIPRRANFEIIRQLPGGRAKFGTWCRGVGYVFETPAAEACARRHLDEARYLWGSRIFVTQAATEATAWLRSEFCRYTAAR